VPKRRSSGCRVDQVVNWWKLAGASAAGILVLGLAPQPTSAEVDVSATGTAQYEYNSNVFALPTGYVVPGVPVSHHEDWFQAYGGAFQVNDDFGQQKFSLTLTGKDYSYNYFTELNHTDYFIDGGWHGTFGALLEAKFDVTRTHNMVAFIDVLQTPLVLQTEQRESGQIGYQFSPNWRIQDVAYYRTVEEPLAGLPNLELSETSEQVTLQYLGRDRLVGGISGTYLTGNFTGSTGNLNPSYQQAQAEMVINYQVTGRSTLVGDAGYSRRTSAVPADDLSRPTGQLVYTNDLTGKTQIQLTVSRDISSYFVDSGSQIETSAIGRVVWLATRRISVSASYAWTDRLLPDQGNTPGTNRIDHLQQVIAKIEYQPFNWLWIESYANLQTRDSNVSIGKFNGNVFGLMFNVHWHCLPAVTFGPTLLTGYRPCPA
jgi:hypothetical protein